MSHWDTLSCRVWDLQCRCHLFLVTISQCSMIPSVSIWTLPPPILFSTRLRVLLRCFCCNLCPLPIPSSLSCFVPGPFCSLNFIPQALLGHLHLHYLSSYQRWFYESHQCVWNGFCLCPRGSGIVGSPSSGRGIFGS